MYFINPGQTFWARLFKTWVTLSGGWAYTANKLSGCKFTALDWFGVAAAILKRALGERLRSLGPRHRLPVPFHRTPAVSQHN